MKFSQMCPLCFSFKWSTYVLNEIFFSFRKTSFFRWWFFFLLKFLYIHSHNVPHLLKQRELIIFAGGL